MNIIKANGGGADKILTLQRAAPLQSVPPAPHPLRAELEAAQVELDAARAELDRQQTAIEQLTAGVEAAYREGETAGRKAGLDAAELREDERLAALSLGVEKAVALFEAALPEEAEHLAVRIGRAALQNILGDVGSYPDLLRRIVQKQVQSVGAQSVLSLEVSADDFPGPAQLAPLTASVGRPGIDIRASEALTSGQCRIGLRLGVLDVGLDHQWTGLDALLSDHMTPQAAE